MIPKVESLLASLHGDVYLHEHGEPSHQRVAPFVTISRQAGAGGNTLAKALERRLNDMDPGERPWASWDKELVSKVALDHHLPASAVESLESEGSHPTWFEDFLSSLGEQASLDEYQLFRRLAITVRGLALVGRCILVGRGAVYATSDLHGGIHVRLVAPLAHRVEHLAKIRGISEKAAASEVRRIDQERDAFHRRYWPDRALLPEIFTITLNAAQVSEEQMVDCILPLLLQPRRPAGAGMHQPVEARNESQ
jgi:cytidylate kinase